MARTARKESRTGIYHVMLRGINRQIIFEDDEDYQKFLWTISKHKGTVLMCCFSPQLGVKFTSGVKKCQGQRGKKAAPGFIT